jgi:hypothetical protein
MHDRILFLQTPVMTSTDDSLILHQHRADRDAPFSATLPRFFNRRTDEFVHMAKSFLLSL